MRAGLFLVVLLVVGCVGDVDRLAAGREWRRCLELRSVVECADMPHWRSGERLARGASVPSIKTGWQRRLDWRRC